jgi:hypothetical protein
MGECLEGITASGRLGPYEGLYDVGICPEKNRRSTTGMVGEVEGWTEEGGVKYAARTRPAASLAGFSLG